MLIFNLCQEHCHCNLHNCIDGNKQQIVQHRIPRYRPRLTRFKEKFEIVNPIPWTSPDTASVIVFLKRHHNTCHGIIGKYQSIENCRRQHQQKYPILIQFFTKSLKTFVFHFHPPFLPNTGIYFSFRYFLFYFLQICLLFFAQFIFNCAILILFLIELSIYYCAFYSICIFYKLFLIKYIHCLIFFNSLCAIAHIIFSSGKIFLKADDCIPINTFL